VGDVVLAAVLGDIVFDVCEGGGVDVRLGLGADIGIRSAAAGCVGL